MPRLRCARLRSARRSDFSSSWSFLGPSGNWISPITIKEWMEIQPALRLSGNKQNVARGKKDPFQVSCDGFLLEVKSLEGFGRWRLKVMAFRTHPFAFAPRLQSLGCCESVEESALKRKSRVCSLIVTRVIFPNQELASLRLPCWFDTPLCGGQTAMCCLLAV